MRPSKEPPTEDVVRFMSHYDIAVRMGRPRERILTWLARLEGAFSASSDAETLTEAIVAGDVRLTLFYLEGLLKLYVERYPQLSDVYERVKGLEDALGALGAASSLTQSVRGVAAPVPCVAWADQQQVTMRQRVVELLGKDWLPDADGRVPLFGELVKILASLEFEKYRRDQKTILNAIRRRLSKLEDADLDMFELQGNRGLHELRRQLRWIPIYCVALDGLVQTDPTSHPIKAYAEFLDSEVARSPYARLPEPLREDRPVAISLSLFLANTHFISELGRLKDSGEIVEGVEHALLGSGAARTSVDARQHALRLLQRTPEEQVAVHLLAENLYKELRKRRFLKRLRAEFKR